MWLHFKKREWFSFGLVWYKREGLLFKFDGIYIVDWMLDYSLFRVIEFAEAIQNLFTFCYSDWTPNTILLRYASTTLWFCIHLITLFLLLFYCAYCDLYRAYIQSVIELNYVDSLIFPCRQKLSQLPNTNQTEHFICTNKQSSISLVQRIVTKEKKKPTILELFNLINF